MERKIKSKALHRTFEVELRRLQEKLSTVQKTNLQYSAQSEETKRHLYSAIDALKSFLDNID